MTDAEIRTECTTTIADAAGMVRIARGAILGAIDISAFNREELSLLRRLAEHFSWLTDQALLLALGFSYRTQALAAIEPEIEVYKPEPPSHDERENKMPTMLTPSKLIDRSRAAAAENDARIEAIGLNLIHRLAVAELENRELAADDPAEIAILLETLGWTHDELLAKVDARKKLIEAHARWLRKDELLEAAKAADAAIVAFDAETAAIIKQRAEELQRLKIAAARAVDAITRVMNDEALLESAPLPTSAAQAQRELAAQAVALRNRENELLDALRPTIRYARPGQSPNPMSEPGQAVTYCEGRLADAKQRRDDSEAKLWTERLALARDAFATTEKTLSVVRKEQAALNFKMQEISSQRFCIMEDSK
jgi:hypothetical protein